MIIIQDTREQIPWDFSFYGHTVSRKTLYPGDYSIEGYEHLVRIERKRTTGEIAINLGRKWKQFQKELSFFSSFPYKYLICEFPIDYLDIFPEKSGIPKNIQSKIRVNSGFLQKRLFETCGELEIKIIFCENKMSAEQKAIEIFNDVIKRNPQTT